MYICVLSCHCINGLAFIFAAALAAAVTFGATNAGSPSLTCDAPAAVRLALLVDTTTTGGAASFVTEACEGARDVVTAITEGSLAALTTDDSLAAVMAATRRSSGSSGSTADIN